MAWAAIGGAAVSVVGGALMNRGKGGGGSTQTQQTWANPFSTAGGLTNATWDEQGQLNTTIDPRLQALQDQTLGRAGQFYGQTPQQVEQMNALSRGFLGAATTYDPMEIARQQYATLSAPLLEQQAQDQLAQESRLFAQGRLGSTGGAQQQQALAKAQEATRAQMLYDSYAQGMAGQQQLFNLGTGYATAAPALQSQYANLGAQYMSPSMQIEQQRYAPAQIAGGLAGATNTGQTQQQTPSLWGNVGAGMMNAGSNMMQNVDWGSLFGPSNYSGVSGVNRGSEQDMMLAQQW